MTETVSPLKNLNTSEGGEDTSAKVSPGKQPGSPILKSRQGGSDVSGKSTFLTGTNLGGKKGYDEKGQKLDEVYSYHDKLNGFIEQLGSTVRTLLSDNQANFLVAYKEQMIIIQKELNQLRKKIDEETYKRKNDERMNILEQERDWFRAEAIRLDKVCKEQQKVIQELKFKMKMLNDDKNYFEDFVLTAKKENKALKEELMQFELGRKSGDDFAQTLSQSKSVPNSHKKGQLYDSAQKRDNSPVQIQNFASNQAAEALQNEYLSLRENLNQQMSYTGEEKLLEVIKQMKIELDKEKKLSRQLRNEKSQIIVRRIELEQILVESINEVKKEISRRRNAKGYKDFNKGPQVPQDIDISKFSATDKRNVLEYFLSNEMVLEEVYNMVFNSPHAPHHAPTSSDQLDNLKAHNPGTSTIPSTKSEGKMKYSFNYGFGSASNIRLGPKELNNVAFSQKAQTLIGELKRPDKRAEAVRREL